MQAPFGVFHSTASGTLIAANTTYALMMGYDSPQELMETVNAKSIADVLYEDPSRRPTLVSEVLHDGGWQKFFNRYRRKDGKIVSAILTIRPYSRLDGSGAELEGFVEDITQRELVEEERKKLQEQLQQSQKIEAVGRLAGGIAHDFNNILTAIFGYCEMGLERAREEDPLRSSFQQIKQSAVRAANLTSQLLTFSRRRMLQPQVVNLGDLVAGMMDMLERVLGEDVDVHAHRAEGLWNVHVDPGQIELVIMNLAVNSRDAMPGGGVLTIETGNTRLEDDSARRHAEAPAGEYVVLAVSDTGRGMDEATLARIYEPFFTTKDVGKGTGLGLATVYGIVKQSSGHIDCYSEIGKGTTFKVYLPRFEGDREEPCQRDRGARSAAIKGASILFVDDDEVVRSIAVSILQSAGYSVASARSGAEALTTLSSLPAPVDLLVTDVVMPGMSGVEIARRVTERFAEARVLYVSGYTEDAVMHHGILRGRVELLQKPFTAADLLQKVSSILASRQR
jgi:PAS domain S-box-containing protein